MTDTTQPSNTVVIAKFFGVKGREALEEIRQLTANDKEQLGNGIRNGTFDY